MSGLRPSNKRLRHQLGVVVEVLAGKLNLQADAALHTIGNSEVLTKPEL